MNIPFVDLKAQYDAIKPEIDKAIAGVINNTAFIKGHYVKTFEDHYAEKYGVKHCIGVANGTDAIFIALKMLGVGPGDEVITTALSWISTSEAISLTGAKPVFVDIEPEYYTIDPSKIEGKVNKTTKAIIPVHLYGQCADMKPILDIAQKYGLYVVEDSAQAHFAEYQGEFAGTMGDAGTFSFYPGKNLGAYGDAGAIITNNDELAEKMRMFANHGALQKHHHKMEGINSRLDGLQAAILDVKLQYILQWNKARRQIAQRYKEQLKNTKSVKTPKERLDGKHIFHVFNIRAADRDRLRTYLRNQEINTAIHYPTPLPFLKPYYKKGNEKEFVNVKDIQTDILSLPIFPEMTDEQINYATQKTINFYNK